MKPAPAPPIRKALPIKAEYFPALTGLRFLLAVWVIVDHLAGKGMMLDAFSQSLPGAVARVMQSGYLAVQTFFILSGFVLAETYGSTRWSRKKLTDYAVARFARVYPAYFFSLIVVSYFIVKYLLFAPGGASKGGSSSTFFCCKAGCHHSASDGIHQRGRFPARFFSTCACREL